MTDRADPRPAGPQLTTLILLSALAIVPVNIFLPSLTNMAAAFEVEYSVVSLSLAAYAAVSAVLQIVLGPLSDRYGRRPVILLGVAIFVVASVGCIVARDIETFLAWRMVQAVIAPTYAVALAAIRDTTAPREAASRIGYLATAWALAPMLGPSFGGLLDEAFGWQASFWFLSLFGAVVLVLCWFDFAETNRNRSKSVVEQFRSYPIVLKSKRFWAYSLCMAFSLGTFFAFLAGAPLAAVAVFDLSPAMLGVGIGSITAGFMFGSFLSGRYAGRLAPMTMILTGRVLACAGLLAGLGLYIAGVDHVLALFGPCMLVGVSNGLTLPSANVGAISVRPQLTGSAAGLAGAISIAGGALMSWIAGISLTAENAHYGLLLVMLGAAAAALSAALVARYLERAVEVRGNGDG